MAKLKSTTVSGTLTATEAITASDFKITKEIGSSTEPIYITKEGIKECTTIPTITYANNILTITTNS